MTKKLFEAPYLKVVEVKNDIITGSAGVGEDYTEGTYEGRVSGRRGFEGDIED